MFYGRIEGETSRILDFIISKYNNVCQYGFELICTLPDNPIQIELYAKKWNPKTTEYEDLTSKQVKEIMVNCVKNNRFTAIPFIIENPFLSHQNILLYDSKYNSMERYDPNTWTVIIPTTSDNIIEKYFKQMIPIKRYYAPMQFCPLFKNLQLIEAFASNEEHYFGGYCVAWSFFYLAQRLENPDIPRDELIIRLVDSLKRNFSIFGRWVSPAKSREKITLFWQFLMANITTREEKYISAATYDFHKLTGKKLGKDINEFDPMYWTSELPYVSPYLGGKNIFYTAENKKINRIAMIGSEVYIKGKQTYMFVMIVDVGDNNWITSSHIKTKNNNYNVINPKNNRIVVVNILRNIEKYYHEIMSENNDLIHIFEKNQLTNFPNNSLSLLTAKMADLLNFFFDIEILLICFFDNIDSVFVSNKVKFEVDIYSKILDKHYVMNVPVKQNFIFEEKRFPGKTIMLLSIICDIMNNDDYDIYVTEK